jgi:hypothetical protein
LSVKQVVRLLVKFYATSFLIAGVIVPVVLHLLTRETMPWWPDAVSLGIAFGVSAVLIVHEARKDREMNGRLWNALKALARHWGSR